MPTRNVPRLMISSRREDAAGCWAWAETVNRAATVRPINILNIKFSPPSNSFDSLVSCDAGFKPDTRALPAGEIKIVSISLCESSVDVFVPYLGNLSVLLDHASSYAKAKNIDPAILLQLRLYPNMYDLTGQVGEANRHAVVACALLAGREPHLFPQAEPDITDLKSRIAAAIDFVQGLPRADIDGA